MTNLQAGDVINGVADLGSNIGNVISDTASNLSSTELALGAAGLGALTGGVATGLLVSSSKKSKSKKKKKKSKKSSKRKKGRKLKFGSKAWRKKYHTKRGWKMDRKRKSKEKHEVAYQRRKARKSKSRRGVHYTKTGQPYILLQNGKSRFIKKKGRKK